MNKTMLIIAIVGGIAVAGGVAAAPYFINTTIDEPLPTGAMMEKKAMEEKAMMEKNAMEEKAMMEKKAMEEKAMMEKKAMEEKAMMEKKAMEDKGMEETSMSYHGTFVGVGDGIHDAKGDAKTIPIGDGQNILRLENFQSTNGPDLFVYLSTDKSASEFVNLGALKANNGNQNYNIPEGTDLQKYSKVLIWCKSFGVLFGHADLTAQ